MLRQGLSNPAIFSLFRPNDYYQIVSGSIVAVQQVGDQSQEPEAPGQDDKRIVASELPEQMLLVFLEALGSVAEAEEQGIAPEAARASPAEGHCRQTCGAHCHRTRGRSRRIGIFQCCGWLGVLQYA